MNNQQIDWHRVETFLYQKTIQLSKPRIDLDDVIEKLNRLWGELGDFSKTRKMLQRIGACLLQNNNTIIAPTCPDYSHENDKYTFKSLSGGVSLLAQKNISFLQKITSILPTAKVMILLADQEANNPELCMAVRKTKYEFTQLIGDSLKATKKEIAHLGWTAACMTEVIQDLLNQEREISEIIATRTDFQQRIITETIQRSDMYYKIKPRITREEMRQRTVNTAAQYVALGRWAATNGYIVCNHTTTNLSWYLQTEAAIFHNPTPIY